MQSRSLSFRQEAEQRALKQLQDTHKQETPASSLNVIAGDTTASPLRRPKQIFLDASASENSVPEEARLAGIDYKLNGGRARSNTDEFIAPRWIPDEEVKSCAKCYSEFDWINRRHHCRHCGQIFCGDCSITKSLLPVAYGERDPQRVCLNCENILRPHQHALTHTIANHQRHNKIDFSGQCSKRYLNMPYSNTMGSEIRKAAYSIHNLFNLEWVQDKAIPLKLLKQAKGLAFLTVLKAGLVFAPRIGTGLVIARLPDNSWSAPSAIGTFGCSWGALVGADITDYVIILNTSEAVEAFSGSGQISIGAGIEIAVGPIGREISGSYNVGTKGFSPAYSYSHSRGAYAGVGLDGSFILSRNAINFNFYGQQLEPDQILRGDISAPRAGQPLYDQLHNAAFSAEDAPSYTPGYSTTLAGGPSQGSDEVTHVKTPTCSSSGASKSSVSGSDFFGEDAANVYNDLKFRREEVGKIDDLNTADICTGGMI